MFLTAIDLGYSDTDLSLEIYSAPFCLHSSLPSIIYPPTSSLILHSLWTLLTATWGLEMDAFLSFFSIVQKNLFRSFPEFLFISQLFRSFSHLKREFFQSLFEKIVVLVMFQKSVRSVKKNDIFSSSFERYQKIYFFRLFWTDIFLFLWTIQVVRPSFVFSFVHKNTAHLYF